MTFRIAFVAVLFTVLLSACNNKMWIECSTTSTYRTKNKALNWAEAPPTTTYGALAQSC